MNGQGVMSIELSIPQSFLTLHKTAAILEFIHGITHKLIAPNNLSYIIRQPQNSGLITTSKFSLTDVFDQLLNLDNIKNGQEAHVNNISRFFSYSALRLDLKGFNSEDYDTDSMSEAIKQIAFSMANRHTSHYLPNPEIINKKTHLPYINIAHCSSIEGGGNCH